MSDIQKIIEKIKKLNRLAKSKNPEEAANAAAFAARLMQEYQIEQAQIEASGEKKSENVSDFLLSENGKSWRFPLAVQIGKICESFVYRSFSGELRLIGTESNLRGAQYLLMLISRQINEMANKGWQELNRASLDLFAEETVSIEDTGKAWKKSFRLGCCNTIRERIEYQLMKQREELRIRAMGEAAIGSALAVIDKNQGKIQAIIKTMRWGTAKKETNTSIAGYNAGKRAGHYVNIGRNASGALGQGNKAIK